MVSRNTASGSLPVPVGLQLTEVAILLGAAVALPLVIHQVPAIGGLPWGARLLAMFVAPFAGLILFRFRIAIVPALLAPFVNNLLFGSPVDAFVGLLTVELAIFTIAACLLLRLDRRFLFTAPAAYLAAKVISVSLMAFGGSFETVAPAGSLMLESVVVAIPGLALLIGLHALLLRRSEHG